MIERDLIGILSYAMIGSGVFALVVLSSGVQAMYGRYSPKSGFMIPARIDWFIQELPSFSIALYYIFQCQNSEGVFILFFFLVHYTNRTFIFPYLMKSRRGTPWYINLSAIMFCTWNGYVQGAWHAKYATYRNFYTDPQTYIGLAIFFTGMYINIQSDSILRNLRKPGETDYKIPRGGMFEYVSGANFFGEIVEWTGFAIMAGTLPAISFAIFTVCNIGPRAMQHHNIKMAKASNLNGSQKSEISKKPENPLSADPKVCSSKIRCSDNQLYRVSPNCLLIESGEAVNIEVTRSRQPSYSIAD